MRIVGGEYRGRKLHAPKGQDIRPTSDRVKEAVFSMLAGVVSGADVLDLFAGSGALGLEALSRGALSVVFVDRNLRSVELIKVNIALCRAQEKSRVISGSAEQAVRKLAANGACFDLVFLDPPYGLGYVEKSLPLLNSIVRSCAVAVVEHSIKDVLPMVCGGWVREKERKYGDTLISMFVRDASDCGFCGCEC